MSRMPPGYEGTARWLTAQGGSAPFRTWMAAALHDPQLGYYAKNVRTVGREGDFSTSATLGTVLGRAIAAWLREEAAHHGWRMRRTTIIEAGPGDGSLHESVLRALGWWHRPAQSLLVETSPGLREKQQQRLGKRRVKWCATLQEALQQCGGRALVFSNELIDAFPFTILQRDDAGDWHEVWLSLTEGGIRETFVPAPAPLSVLFDPAAASRLAPLQRVESADAAHDWLAAWVPDLKQGSVLTVDYGDLFPTLYHRRPLGTLRGYHRHQRVEAPVIHANMGHVDITADVNFSDLMRRGEMSGLTTVACPTQAEFIRARLRGKLAGADARLADPDGAGGAFRCLMQRRSR